MNAIQQALDDLNEAKREHEVLGQRFEAVQQNLEAQWQVNADILSLDWSDPELVNPLELPQIKQSSLDFDPPEIRYWTENTNFAALASDFQIVILDYQVTNSEGRNMIVRLEEILEEKRHDLITNLVMAYTHNWQVDKFRIGLLYFRLMLVIVL